jgi:hypothetical protein
MRREHFTAAVEAREQGVPALHVTYDGPGEALSDRVTDESGEPFGTDEIDAAFRLQDPLDADDATGVFGLTHRVTGDYLLEINVDAGALLSMVQSARDTDEASYRVRVDYADQTIVYDMCALFVYDHTGELLRQRSLIPSGVEL